MALMATFSPIMRKTYEYSSFGTQLTAHLVLREVHRAVASRPKLLLEEILLLDVALERFDEHRSRYSSSFHFLQI